MNVRQWWRHLWGPPEEETVFRPQLVPNLYINNMVETSWGCTSGSATLFRSPTTRTPIAMDTPLLRKEWKCEWCGGVNPYEELDEKGHPQHIGRCKNCGGVKLVIQMASVA